MKWRHALAHPEVAKNQEEALGNQLKFYYIFDPVDVIKSSNTNADNRDSALEAYLSIKKSPIKVNQYLTLLGVNPKEHRGNEYVTLRAIAEKEPAKFIKVHSDPNKDQKFFLLDLINAKILEQVGSRILITESGFQIGASIKEAIAYIKDPTNSQQIVIFKSLLQDWRKEHSLANEETSESSESKGAPVTQ